MLRGFEETLGRIFESWGVLQVIGEPFTLEEKERVPGKGPSTPVLRSTILGSVDMKLSIFGEVGWKLIPAFSIEREEASTMTC